MNRKSRSHRGSQLDLAHDARVRAAAFAWLTEQVARLGTDVLPHALLAEGFRFESTRVPLVAPQGIFKPKVLDAAPLSIRTAHGGPYDDTIGPDNLLRYRYRLLDGVEWPTASTILHFYAARPYPILDYRALCYTASARLPHPYRAAGGIGRARLVPAML